MNHAEKQDEPIDKPVSIPEYPLYEVDGANPECVPPSDVPINFGHYSYLLEKDDFKETCIMVGNTSYWTNKK